MDRHQSLTTPSNGMIESSTTNVPPTGKVSQPYSSSNSSICSPTCGSSSSTSSTTSSLPQYSEDVRQAAGVTPQQTPPALNLLPRQGSGSSSTKTCEVDVGDEERDTFSPVSSTNSNSTTANNSSHCSPCDVDCGATIIGATSNDTTSNNVILFDNKVHDGATQAAAASSAAASPVSSALRLKVNHNYNASGSGGGNGSGNGTGTGTGSLHSTTKEEKQRQNEEIVIMETSSISSETGSWESVYPHTSTTAVVHVSASKIPSSCSEMLYGEQQSKAHDQRSKEKEKEKEKEKVEHDVPYSASPFKLGNANSTSNTGLAPYVRERTYSTGAAVTADTSSLFNSGSTSSLLHELNKRDNALVASGTSACFIDASSLRDEDEVMSFPSLDGQPSTDDLNDQDKVLEDAQIETSTHSPEHDDDEDAALLAEPDDDSPTKKLESFHKAFAKCKLKSKDLPAQVSRNDNVSQSCSSSNSEADSPGKATSTTSPNSTNNLSDEEKLWKRDLNTRTKVPPIEGSHRENGVDRDLPHEDVTEASVSLAADLDSSDSSDVVKLRREQEKKHNSTTAGGSYIFHHNMQQFSVHPLGVSPKFPAHCTPAATAATATAPTGTPHHSGVGANTAHSDLSYTTDYSSSSPAPSLVWSEHENRPSTGNALYDAPAQKPSLLPETPHNSIVHIDAGSSNASSIHRDYTLSSSLSHQRDSGAYCSDATDSPVPMPRTPKRFKCDEANPIVSGGASIKDFNIKQCESPPVKRRIDTCPIVSGGFVSLDFEPTRPIGDDEDEVELRAKPKTRKPISGIASWVVDMSDCRSERRKSTSSTSSIENTAGIKPRERSDSSSSHKSGCGFYVSLGDMDKRPDECQATAKQVKSPMSKSFTAPKPTGFFVNLSKSEYVEKADTDPSAESGSNPNPPEDEQSDARKNMFSMFIDIGDKRSNKKEPLNLAARLSSSLTSAQRRSDEMMKSSASSTETLMSRSSNFKTAPDNELTAHDLHSMESKSLDYRCNMEPPITVAAIRRLSQQQRAQNDATKRHSWGNNTQPRSETGAGHDYKRSISLTANGDGKEGTGGNNSGLMSIIDKIPLIAKTSSLSVDSSLSPYDEYTCSKSELSTCSNNSVRNSMSGGEREDDLAGHNSITHNVVRTKRRRRDVQINETFDKSSLASITDGVLSKDLSPASTTDTDDLTFQQDEELALREAAALHQHEVNSQPQLLSTSNRSSAIIMETIIEAKETSSPKKAANGHTLESLHATIEKQKMLLETVNEHGEIEKGNFVKLSDMDKPIKFELHSPEAMMSKSVGNHRHINRLFRDESKGRPHSWTMTRSTGNSFLNITNSVDNLRSLSRLFPNFSKEFSNSLPNDMILDQMDYIQTDISGDSSLASSFSRSGMDESSISCRQPRRLGEDLLKMFLQEIATDMIVEVHGRRIKAHKCILRSRCQYFAAMLAGNGAQSVVSLHGYSYSAVHFALCHIYSGASHPPDGISLMELAALADLLGLEGLKEVTAHALKTNYCHNFHKPCSGCIEGILQVLPVALNHALDDLYRKCLRWTCRHYLKVWPTRQFAQLPPDILGRCRQQIVAYLTPESVLDTVLDCDNLLTQLATYRWGGICESLVRDILDAAYVYIADHFASLIASDAFLSLGHDRSCHIPHLEGVLLRTASSLTPDQACRSYQRVTRLNTVLQAKILHMPANLGELAKELQGLQEEDLEWDKEYVRLVSAILSAVEQGLIRQCSRAMRVTAWQRMDLDLRKKIQTLARLTEPIDLKRSKPVSKAFSFGGSTRNQDLYQVKLAIQAHSKRALAQDTQLYKATQTHEANNVQTTERGVQANNDLREGTSKILKSNSRAHVPQTIYKSVSTIQSATVSERNSINAHRRTQSDATAVSTTANKPKPNCEPKSEKNGTKQQQPAKAPLRLADVRPRYLEPRKTRSATSAGPVRSATSSSIPASSTAHQGKGRQISSSDSSRNSSPAAARKANTVGAVKIGTKSTNMSLDSLASPSRRGRSAMLNNGRRGLRGKSSDTERFSDVGIDSLAESMKSSVITNKTISQESLTSAAKLSRSNPILLGTNKSITIGPDNKTLNGNIKLKNNTTGSSGNVICKTAGGTAAHKHLVHHHITSAGSSPSSVTTTKSAASRISSVSSTQSTRDIYKHRSISVPAGQQDNNNSTTTAQSNQRRSFLSAKSREILAKRAEKNKQMQLELEKEKQQQGNISSDEKSSGQMQQRNSTGPLRSASHTAVPSMGNRQSLPSNIPTRRPNTLQLKKTNGPGSSKPMTNSNKTKKSNVSNGLDTLETINMKLTKDIAMNQKLAIIIDNNSASRDQRNALNDSSSPQELPLRIESKLERSSTFCKDNSDLDLSELQIIE